MFPETLQRAVGPTKTLPRERAHRLGRFGPGDCVRHVNDTLTPSCVGQRQIGVFGERFQTQTTGIVDGRSFRMALIAPGTTVMQFQTLVSTAIEIEAAGIFQRLTIRDKRSQVPNLRMT